MLEHCCIGVGCYRSSDEIAVAPLVERRGSSRDAVLDVAGVNSQKGVCAKATSNSPLRSRSAFCAVLPDSALIFTLG